MSPSTTIAKKTVNWNWISSSNLGTHIYPIEVKAEENLQAKSLKTTLANNPTLVGLRFSMSDYREQDRLTNVPLYGINAYLETKKDI